MLDDIILRNKQYEYKLKIPQNPIQTQLLNACYVCCFACFVLFEVFVFVRAIVPRNSKLFNLFISFQNKYTNVNLHSIINYLSIEQYVHQALLWNMFLFQFLSSSLSVLYYWLTFFMIICNLRRMLMQLSWKKWTNIAEALS